MYNIKRYNQEVYNARPWYTELIIKVTASFNEGVIRAKFVLGQLIAKIQSRS